MPQTVLLCKVSPAEFHFHFGTSEQNFNITRCLYHATQRATKAGSDVNGRSEGAFHRSHRFVNSLANFVGVAWKLPPTRPLTEEKAVEKILSTLHEQ